MYPTVPACLVTSTVAIAVSSAFANGVRVDCPRPLSDCLCRPPGVVVGAVVLAGVPVEVVVLLALGDAGPAAEEAGDREPLAGCALDALDLAALAVETGDRTYAVHCRVLRVVLPRFL